MIADRFRAIDPLVGAGDGATRPDGRRLRAGDATAVAEVVDVEPEAAAAIWVPLRRHRLLDVEAPDGDVPTALAGLIEAWRGTMEPGASEERAVLDWPSRDTAVPPVLLAAGLVPTTFLSIRRLADAGAPGAGVRPARDSDAEAVIALHLELLGWEARFGVGHLRPATRNRLQEQVTESIAAGERTWVAESAGRVVATVDVSPPAEAGWITGTTALPADRVAYLGTLVVTADRRSAGVGTALVAAAQASLRDRGAEAVLLHHTVANPLATPFWFRQGYRPLWTTWSADPAVFARA